MPKVVKEDIDALNAVINITINKEDYEPKLLADLKKYRNEARIKGFRPGKTPMSVIKKRVGKSLLAEAVHEILQKELYAFLSKENEQILGQPLTSEDQEEFEFNVNDLREYTFKLDVGKAPEFELSGLNSDDALTYYKMEITDEMINSELDNARMRAGTRNTVEADIEDNDLLKLAVAELDDAGNIVEEGLSANFSVLTRDIVDEDFKAAIPGLKVGDELNLNLLQLEKDIDEKFVKRNYLGLQEELDRPLPALFKATLVEISRVEAAELNEQFFDSYFGPGLIKTEEEARNKFREDMSNYYDTQSDALFFREIQQYLMKVNDFPLPEAFLKRWLSASNQEVSKEHIEKEFPAFAQNLKWSILTEKLNKKYEVKVEEADIRAGMKDRLMRMYGPQTAQLGDAVVESLVDRLMQDEEQLRPVREEVMSNKLFAAVNPDITRVEEKVSLQEFLEISNKVREEVMADQQPATETQEGTDTAEEASSDAE